MRFIRRFLWFWWDFIVGDSITLAIGTCVLLAAGGALAAVRPSGAVELVLPAIVVITLTLSLRRS